jgi:hypothetical protein
MDPEYDAASPHRRTNRGHPQRMPPHYSLRIEAHKGQLPLLQGFVQEHAQLLHVN